MHMWIYVFGWLTSSCSYSEEVCQLDQHPSHQCTKHGSSRQSWEQCRWKAFMAVNEQTMTNGTRNVTMESWTTVVTINTLKTIRPLGLPLTATSKKTFGRFLAAMLVMRKRYKHTSLREMTAGNYRHCGTRWMDDISGNEIGLYLLMMKSESYVER